jgi:hypothetical protein
MPSEHQVAQQRHADVFSTPLLIYTADDLEYAIARAIEVERQHREPYPREWE